MTDKLLVPQQDYLAAGIHIGMKSRTKDMEKFIYKIREDGLAVLNLQMLDERLRMAIKFLMSKEKMMIIGRKTNSHLPITKFAEAVGCDYVVGRFMPGTLTNPNYDKYVEPDVVMIVDPMSDRQALNEAVDSRIPVIALCDTFNETRNIDLVIPCNNKGKKSLGLIFWVMVREVLKSRDKKKFEMKVKEFTSE